MERPKVESVDVRISNADTKGRKHAIAATAHIEDGRVAYMQYGSVETLPGGVETLPGGVEAPVQLATFDTWNAGNLSAQFLTEGKRGAILTEVEEFAPLALAEAERIAALVAAEKEITASSVNA